MTKDDVDYVVPRLRKAIEATMADLDENFGPFAERGLPLRITP
jgi:hypothetical protein